MGNQRLFAFALVFSLVPLWTVDYLPSVDLPQHAAQVAALHEILQGSPMFHQAFEVNLFTPYLFGYFLLFLLNFLMPISMATKVLVSIAVVSIPLMTDLLLGEVGGDRRFRWLAIPAGYSFAFYWGFLSYMIAVPLGLLMLVLTIRFHRAPGIGRALVISAYLVLLFFCHVMVLGVAGLIAVAYLLAANLGQWKRALALCLPYAAPLPLMLAWLYLTHATEEYVQGAPVQFGPIRERFTSLAFQAAGSDGFLTPLAVLLCILVFAFPFVFGARPSTRPERWAPFLAAAAVYFTFPSYAQGTAFLFHRFGVFLVPLWLIAWDPPSRTPARRQWLAVGLVAVWAFVNLTRFSVYDADTRDFREVSALMEPKKRVGYLVVDKQSWHFTSPVFLHLGAWYQAEKRGIVDFNFAVFYPQMVRFRDMTAPRITENVVWYPGQFDWESHGGSQYDYFLVRSKSDVGDPLFKEHMAELRLVAHTGEMWLYTRATAASLDEPVSPR